MNEIIKTYKVKDGFITLSLVELTALRDQYYKWHEQYKSTMLGALILGRAELLNEILKLK